VVNVVNVLTVDVVNVLIVDVVDAQQVCSPADMYDAHTTKRAPEGRANTRRAKQECCKLNGSW